MPDDMQSITVSSEPYAASPAQETSDLSFTAAPEGVELELERERK